MLVYQRGNDHFMVNAQRTSTLQKQNFQKDDAVHADFIEIQSALEFPLQKWRW